jgi:uncharacterized glyoxalase superfamily protein PhnB
MPDVCVCLRYRDARAAVVWLCAAFGFERHAVHEDDGGSVTHAELRHGDSVVLLGPARDDVFGDRVGQGWAYVVVADADAHHARAVEAGAEIVMELTDTGYGSRDYSARDLEGNVWSFGTYRPVIST